MPASSTTHRTAAAAALGALALVAAAAATAPTAPARAGEHLRVTGQGENFAVEYDPAYEGNLVGGGLALAAPVEDAATGEARYHDASRAQRPVGVPTVVGNGEHTSLAYAPFPAATTPPRTLLAGRAAR